MRDLKTIKNLLFICVVLLAISCNSCLAAIVSNDVSVRIKNAIISYLVQKEPSYAGKKIEVTYKYADRIFRDLKARQGKVTFAIAELYPDFKPVGNIIVPVQVYVDDAPKEKIFLRTKVSVFDRIVVAKSRLKRGDLISSNEATLEERDIGALNPSIIKDINLVLGKEAKTFIPNENPIYEWMIRERPFVRKNEKIKITAGSNNVLVAAVGLSLEDGSMGAEIKVKNLGSGKELIGMVTGTGEVMVK